MTSVPFSFLPAQQGAEFSFGNTYTGDTTGAHSSVGDISSLSGTISSSPATPLDGSLLSPANISLPGSNSSGISIGSLGKDSHAYNIVMQRYQLLEREYQREKREHNTLRAAHEELAKAHGKLMDAFTQDRVDLKRSQPGDPSTTLATPGQGFPEDMKSLEEGKNFWKLSKSDFPDVKYWRKEDWTRRQRADDIDTQPGSRGSTRRARGENVRTKYIENADGTPVSGDVASDIREQARSIWRGFAQRGIAPDTWGSATREVENEFRFEMEKSWPVLRYCENHWKVRHLATSIYSQWHGQPGGGETDGSEAQQSTQKRKQGQNKGQAKKKARTTIEDDEEVGGLDLEEMDTADPDISSSIPPIEDIGDPEHMGQEDVRRPTPRPRARPLRNPLENVFSQPNATPFQVHDVVPDVISVTRPSDAQNQCSTHSGGTNSFDRAVDNTGADTTSNAAPVAPVVPAAPASIPVPSSSNAAPVAPVAPANIPVPGSSNTALVAPVAPITLTAPTVPTEPTALTVPAAPATTEAGIGMSDTAIIFEDRLRSSATRREQRYHRRNKMKPGYGSTTARKAAAHDWCRSHPDGTEGEFNRWYDFLPRDDPAMKEYERIAREESQKVREERKNKGLPPRRAPGNITSTE